MRGKSQERAEIKMMKFIVRRQTDRETALDKFEPDRPTNGPLQFLSS